MRFIHAILGGAALCGILVLSGCGPSKAGQVARADARERVNSFKASYTYQQAEQYFGTGDFDRALNEADLAIQQAPGAAMFHLLRARILLEMHRMEDAVASLTTAITLDESSPAAYYYRGIAMQRWQQDDEALADYRKALEFERSNVQYLLASAEMLVTLGRTDEATELVQAQLAFFEHNPVLVQFLGHTAMIRGDHARAAEYFLQARLADPANVSLMEEHLWAQYESGDFGGALATVEIIRTRTGKLRQDLLLIEARSLMQVGQKVEAHRRYRDIVKENPASVHAWIELGAVAWDLGDHVRLQEAASRVVTLNAARYEGWMLQGIAEQRRGRTADAIASYRTAVERSSIETVPLLLL